MEFDDIKFIYPDAQLTNLSLETSDYISFPFKKQWIQFEKKSKNSSELKLLQFLFNSKKIKNSS